MVRKPQTEDEELVRLAQNGDPDAFGELVLRYQNKMYGLARRMTDTEEDAEDVIQEAFVKAFNSIGSFRGDSRFSTWLYRITVNHALVKLRKRGMPSVSLDAPDSTGEYALLGSLLDIGPDPLTKLLEGESQRVLDDAIADLPSNYRTVFVLRHIEEISTAEIGRMLKASTSAVKSRLHRARIALRNRLQRKIEAELSTQQARSMCNAA